MTVERLSPLPACSVQNGTNDNDFVTAACAGEDGSFVLAGVSTGDWSGLNVGSNDFTAIKVDSEGGEIWRWQVWWAARAARLRWYISCIPSPQE